MSSEKVPGDNSDRLGYENRKPKDFSEASEDINQEFQMFGNSFFTKGMDRINDKLDRMERRINEGQLALLESFVELALDWSSMLNHKGFYQEALSYAKRCISACERLLDLNSRFGKMRYPMILYLYADISHSLKAEMDLPNAYVKSETAYENLLNGEIRIEKRDYVNCIRDYAECLLDHAIYLYETHRSDIEAIALLRKAEQYHSFFDDASRDERIGFYVSLYSNIGRCLIRIGDEKGVCAACNTLIEKLENEEKQTLLIKEGIINAWNTIASIMRKEGSIDKAIDYYFRCRKYHREHRLRPKKNNREDILIAFRIDETMRRIQLSLIEAFIQNNEFKKALSEIRAFRKMDLFEPIDRKFLNEIPGLEKLYWPGSQQARISSWEAICLRHLGRTEEALQKINTALSEEMKNDPPVHSITGRIRQEQAEIFLQRGDTKQAALSMEIACSDFINDQDELSENDVLQAFHVLRIIAEKADLLGKDPKKVYLKAIDFGSMYLNKGMLSLRFPLACLWISYSDLFRGSKERTKQRDCCLNALRILLLIYDEVRDDLIPAPKGLKEILDDLINRLETLVPEKQRDQYEIIKASLKNF